MAVKHELELKELILGTGLLRPVEVTSKGGMLSALCRSVPGQEKNILELFRELIFTAENNGVTGLLVAKRFVLKGEQLVSGWFIELRAKNAAELSRDLGILKEDFHAAKPSLVDPEEVPKAAPREDPVQAQKYQSPYNTQVKVTERLNGNVVKDATAGILGNMDSQPMNYKAQGPGPHIRVLQVGQTQDGKPVVVTQMPLPHMTGKDMNVPNEKGRGAALSGKATHLAALQRRKEQ